MEKLKWISGKDLISKLDNLSEETKKEIIDTFLMNSDKPYEVYDLKESLKYTELWYVHKGDLILDSSFSPELSLIVMGNLIINGTYDDYRLSGEGHIIVKENMEAEHILSWGDLTVLGDITVKGLIYNTYNDFRFECKGKIQCKAFYVDDKDTTYKDELLKTEFLRDYDGDITGPTITDFFIEDVLEYDEDYDDASLDWDKVKIVVSEGKNIFK